MNRRRSASFRQVFGPGHIRLPGIIMFGRYQYAASQTGLLPQAHRHAIEICFLERGEQTYRVRDRVYRLRGNDQFFTLPGEVHDTAQLPQERGILYWLILSVAPSKGFLGLASGLGRQLQRELCRMPVRHFNAHPDCARLLGEITRLLSDRSPGRPDTSRRLFLQSRVLQYLTLTLDASGRGARKTATPLIRRVLSHMENHLDDPIRVPELARIARLSESRFKIRFKREMGVPPAEFWLRKKIERAAVLLKDRPVTEVAYALGFSSSQYFATAFKRYTLANPSQFHSRGQSGRRRALP
jgi:AraC-like DNA-binding protein